jgi:beta-glucosidase
VCDATDDAIKNHCLVPNKKSLIIKLSAMKKYSSLIFISVSLMTTTIHAQNWNEKTNGSVATVTNKGGQTLGYSTTSGVKIISADGFAFKDLNKNGKLDKYEDWRLPADVRAKDLASKMSVEQIAGLMLYSRHQPIPNPPGGFFAGTYNGKKFPESGAKASDLTDQQKEFLTKDNLRHVLLTSEWLLSLIKDARTAKYKKK